MGLQSTATGKVTQARRTGPVATSLRLDFSQPKKEKVPDIPRRGGGRDAALCSVLVHPEAGRDLADADTALGHFGEGGTS